MEIYHFSNNIKVGNFKLTPTHIIKFKTLLVTYDLVNKIKKIDNNNTYQSFFEYKNIEEYLIDDLLTLLNKEFNNIIELNKLKRNQYLKKNNYIIKKLLFNLYVYLKSNEFDLKLIKSNNNDNILHFLVLLYKYKFSFLKFLILFTTDDIISKKILYYADKSNKYNVIPFKLL